ncbi:MAG: hypothetical protein AAGA56_17220 [Myxococcota bacterium]
MSELDPERGAAPVPPVVTDPTPGLSDASPATSDVPVAAPPAEALPLFASRKLAIDVDGATWLSGLTFSSVGEGVLIIGDASPIFGVLSGLPLGDNWGHCRVASGEWTVNGASVVAGGHRAVCNASPATMVWSGGFTVTEWLAWASRLRGRSRWTTTRHARSLLAGLDLHALGRRRLFELSPLERRLAQIALAVVDDSPVMAVEAPFDDLDERSTDAVWSVLGVAAAGRRVILTASPRASFSAVRQLAEEASDVVVLYGGRCLYAGPSADIFDRPRVYGVTLADEEGGVGAVIDALHEVGIELRGGPRVYLAVCPGGASATDIVLAAHRAAIVVHGCEPLWGRALTGP